MKFSPFILTLFLAAAAPLDAKAKKIDDYHWSGVERVVAIGDLHGDYNQYINVMQSAGLLDKKGKWSGGKTHLVQTGDITDRGDDSRKNNRPPCESGQTSQKERWLCTPVDRKSRINECCR